MKLRAIVVVVALALLASGCGGSGGTTSSSGSYSTEIDNFINQFVTNYRSMNASDLAALFDSKVILHGPTDDLEVTRGQIEALYSLAFTVTNITSAIVKAKSVTISGTTATVNLTLEITDTAQVPPVYDGVFLWVIKRIGSKWFITEMTPPE